MSPIEFAREMRSRGWRHARHAKRIVVFSIRFPNGFGVSRAFDVASLAATEFGPRSFADFITRDAALSARFDMRSVGVPA